MASPSKSQTLTKVHTLLKKHYKPGPSAQRMTVLEAVIYAICHEGATREQANQALSRLKDQFYDWNEVRVSSLDEIQATLAGLPDAESRAFRLRRFLRQLFTKTYGFSLEALIKKPQKEAHKVLGEYEAFGSEYVDASVVLYSLSGHAIPIDPPARRALVRLGLAEPDTELKSLRSLVERAIPKNRGAEFADLLEDLTQDVCIEALPDCPRCSLKKICPTAHAREAEIQAAAKAARAAAKIAAQPRKPTKEIPSKPTKPIKKTTPTPKKSPRPK